MKLPIPVPFILGVDLYFHLVSSSSLCAALSSLASSLQILAALASSWPLLFQSGSPDSSAQVAPPCTAAWKLSKGRKLGQSQDSPLSYLSEITLLCYLMSNALQIIRKSLLHILVSGFCLFFSVISGGRVNLVPVAVSWQEEEILVSNFLKIHFHYF